MPSFLTLAPGADRTAEIEVRKSRFLAVVRRVDSEDDARALVSELRRQHHDARHHCSAFIIGPAPPIERSNDDGEPAGSAGQPMLDVLRGHDLSDVAAVVVRWFGGTLLGAGGLVRAYGDAVSAALAAAPLVRRMRFDLFDLAVSHADAGKVEADLRAAGAVVDGVRYAEQATLRLVGTEDRLSPLVAQITTGRGRLVPAGTSWLDVPAT